jgi:hypothetical protein
MRSPNRLLAHEHCAACCSVRSIRRVPELSINLP